jgi:hypothetical protein
MTAAPNFDSMDDLKLVIMEQLFCYGLQNTFQLHRWQLRTNTIQPKSGQPPDLALVRTFRTPRSANRPSPKWRSRHPVGSVSTANLSPSGRGPWPR